MSYQLTRSLFVQHRPKEAECERLLRNIKRQVSLAPFIHKFLTLPTSLRLTHLARLNLECQQQQQQSTINDDKR